MGKPLRALIVDDSESDAELLRLELRREGFGVASERVDTAEAMSAALAKEAWDVVFSDYSMPRFDPFSALSLMRAKGLDLPFIIVSGIAGEEVAVEAMKAGAHDYFRKDKLSPRLGAVVERELREAASRAERRRAEEALRRAEERYRGIFENLVAGIYQTTLDGRYVTANPTLARTLGYASPEELIAMGSDVDHRFYVDAGRRAGFVRIMEERGSVRDFESRVYRKDGSVIWVSEAARAVRDAEGRLVGFEGTTVDITARKEQESRILRLNRVYSVLSGINTAIVRLRDRKELFAEACRVAVEQGQFRMAWIGLLTPDKSAVTTVAKAGVEDGYLERIRLSVDETLPEGTKLVAQALRERAPVVANDIGSDTRMAHWRHEALQRGFRSAVVFPLSVDDEAVGVFVLYAAEVEFFDTEEMRLLTGLAADVSFALAYITNTERLAYLAYFDALTGMPNRALFHDRVNQLLQAANRDDGMAAVLAVDLERFRDVNESYGRSVGDAVLVEVARRLGVLAQDAQHVARTGGNSFGVALANLRQAAEVARALEERIFEGLDRPFEVDGEEVRLKTRAGIALFPSDGMDADTLFRNAETALGTAKRSGVRFLFYTPELNAAVAEKLVLERRLRRALELDQMVLHYQPKVDLKSGKISGLEALLRWNDPETGLVPPMKFIPVLEETGMISAVGRWALAKALADSLVWQQQGLPALSVAVNVSAMQFRESDFVDAVAEVLAGAEGVAGGLELEITETMIMEEIEAIIPKLRAIRDMGVQVAIDDFGTGYSSLSYLARLPINALKIDRAFIKNMTRSPDDVAIVSTIISLAHSLSLRVVAEGVETQEQVWLLRLLKCDEIQGFLFSPGVPAEHIEVLQREGRSLPS